MVTIHDRGKYVQFIPKDNTVSLKKYQLIRWGQYGMVEIEEVHLKQKRGRKQMVHSSQLKIYDRYNNMHSLRPRTNLD